MTDMEKFRMFQEKNSFIRKLDLILTTPKPKGMSVEGVEYEVWERAVEGDTKKYQEVIVLTFVGGATLPLSVNGNSNSANLRAIADNIDGGDFSFVPMYTRFSEMHWKLVDLD